jgi:hypothetical protein
MRLIIEILMVLLVVAIIAFKWMTGQDETEPKASIKNIEINTSKLQQELTQATSILAPEQSKQPVKKLKDVNPKSKIPAKDQSAINKIQLKFNTGDFVGALSFADQLRLSEYSKSFRQWLDIQMPALLTATGWSYLQLGNCEDAIQILLRSESYKRTPDTARGLTFCYRKNRSLYAAEEQLLWQNSEDPKNIQTVLFLMDVWESLGEFSRAAILLDETIKDNQDAEPNLLKKLSAKFKEIKSKAQEGQKQQTIKSQYFILKFRQYEHAHLSEVVLNTLSESLEEFIENYSFREPKTPIEVLLYPGANFQQVVSNSPKWAEGLFDGRMKIPVKKQWIEDQDQNFTDLRRILRHELVHALLAQMTDFRTIPSWFNEGLAQRLQCEQNKCRQFSFAPKPGHFLTEEEFTQPYTSFNTLKASSAYSQSLYLIYTIENIEAVTSPFKSIIEKLTINSKLNSNALLRHISLNFQEVMVQAKSNWDARKQLSPQD